MSSQRRGLSSLGWHIRRDELNVQNMIGKGASGQVFRAAFRRSEVAAKKVAVHDESSLVEVMGEVSVMSKLRHPNIVGFLGLAFDPPEIILVTEYMHYGSLYDILHNKPDVRLPWASRLSFLLQTAKAMNYLHCFAPPMIHRDLKSPNILVDSTWTVKVADFGLTRLKSDLKMTVCGTPWWSAPEILVDDTNYSEKCDVYSFGIIVFEVLTRCLPYTFNPMHTAIEVTVNGRRPVLPQCCPPCIADLARRCWATSPDARPSFDVVVGEMDRLVGNCKEIFAGIPDDVPYMGEAKPDPDCPSGSPSAPSSRTTSTAAVDAEQALPSPASVPRVAEAINSGSCTSNIVLSSLIDR
eukprot:gnl/Trimastix_PCT/5135.p1 GENE.gnl/Trimastix_PCT/5135~~gnl/Trimastix_PCT/5135.p1  ORF type:complete len:353 (-),score=104.50 gnl/Trimastix_PCT/5135:45-1103(-)